MTTAISKINIIKFNIKLPLLNNEDATNKLLYLLKTLDQEESNNETIIRNSKSDYVKTLMLNSEKDPFKEPEQKEHRQEHRQEHHQQQCQQM